MVKYFNCNSIKYLQWLCFLSLNFADVKVTNWHFMLVLILGYWTVSKCLEKYCLQLWTFLHMSLKCIVFLNVIKYIILSDCFVICVGSSLLSKQQMWHWHPIRDPHTQFSQIKSWYILFYTLSSSVVTFNIFSSNWFLFFKKSVGDKLQPLIVTNSYKLMGQWFSANH